MPGFSSAAPLLLRRILVIGATIRAEVSGGGSVAEAAKVGELQLGIAGATAAAAAGANVGGRAFLSGFGGVLPAALVTCLNEPGCMWVLSDLSPSQAPLVSGLMTTRQGTTTMLGSTLDQFTMDTPLQLKSGWRGGRRRGTRWKHSQTQGY